MTLKPSPSREVLRTRRVTLLASVAALGAAVLLAGPGGYGPSGLTASARATEAVAQHPASFADVVAKVKPAVISVRVKVDAMADAGLMEQNGGEDVTSAQSELADVQVLPAFQPRGNARHAATP